MAKPEAIGDLAQFVYTPIPPTESPSSRPTSVKVWVIDPAGVQRGPIDCTNLGGGDSWLFTDTNVIDQPGTWKYHGKADGPLKDGFDTFVVINDSPFTFP